MSFCQWYKYYTDFESRHIHVSWCKQVQWNRLRPKLTYLPKFCHIYQRSCNWYILSSRALWSHYYLLIEVLKNLRRVKLRLLVSSKAVHRKQSWARGEYYNKTAAIACPNVTCLKGAVLVLYFNLILLHSGGRFGVPSYNFCNNL